MPTYVYLCQSCMKTSEVVQRITEEPLKSCPECTGEVRRQIQPVQAIYACGGFHNTDYGR